MDDAEALARRVYDAWLRRDVEEFRELVTDDAELSPALASMLEGRVYRGRDGVADFIASFDEMWADFEFELGALEVDGDHVLQLGRMRGTARASGMRFEEQSGSVSVVRDGRIASWRAFMSHDQARELFESLRGQP